MRRRMPAEKRSIVNFENALLRESPTPLASLQLAAGYAVYAALAIVVCGCGNNCDSTSQLIWSRHHVAPQFVPVEPLRPKKEN